MISTHSSQFAGNSWHCMKRSHYIRSLFYNCSSRHPSFLKRWKGVAWTTIEGIRRLSQARVFRVLRHSSREWHSREDDDSGRYLTRSHQRFTVTANLSANTWKLTDATLCASTERIDVFPGYKSRCKRKRQTISFLKVGRSPIDQNARLRGHETRCDRRKSQVHTHEGTFSEVTSLLFCSFRIATETLSLSFPIRGTSLFSIAWMQTFSLFVEWEDCTLRDDGICFILIVLCVLLEFRKSLQKNLIYLKIFNWREMREFMSIACRCSNLAIYSL